MDAKRRNFLRGLASIAGAATAGTAAAQHVHPPDDAKQAAPATPLAARLPPNNLGPGVIPVITPDVPDMPWRLEDGVKVFEINVGHVRTEFIPGRIVDASWKHGSTDGEIFTLIRDGATGTPMKAFGKKLTAEQTWDVINYLRSIGPTPGTSH